MWLEIKAVKVTGRQLVSPVQQGCAPIGRATAMGDRVLQVGQLLDQKGQGETVENVCIGFKQAPLHQALGRQSGHTVE
ncbi:hypothetical protein D3C75_1123890 [compost metagenome]